MTSKFVALCVALFITAPAYAIQLDADGCQRLAQFAYSVAQIRDLGADEGKHVAAVAKHNVDQPLELQAFIEKLVRGVYASNATPEQLGQATLTMCLAKDGKIGEEV